MTKFDTAAAIARANKWTAIGRELATAMFELGRRIDYMAGAGYYRREIDDSEPRAEMTKAMDEAGRVLSGARDELAQAMDNWRRVLIEDSQPPCPIGTDEAEWSAHEATCAAIESAVISVGALIKKMEMEA